MYILGADIHIYFYKLNISVGILYICFKILEKKINVHKNDEVEKKMIKINLIYKHFCYLILLKG